MTVTTATITGRILSPLAQPLPNQRIIIRAVTAGGTLTTTDGDLLTYQSSAYTDTAGNINITLPQLPQASVYPTDARWRIDFPPRWGMDHVEFQLTGNLMWDDIVDVSGVDATSSLLAQMTSIRDEIVSSAVRVKELAPWFAALANRDATPAKILFLGNSILEGTGASTYEKRSQFLIRDRLRKMYPVTARPGTGYIPALMAWAPDSPVTLGGTPDTLVNANGLGLKARIAQTGDTVTWPATYCDRIRLWYYTHPFGGTADIKIDGSTVTSLSSNATPEAAEQYDSGALTPGWHTLQVAGTNGTYNFTFGAAEFFNGDWGKGVHTYDAAHFGYATGSYITANADNLGHWNAVADLKPQLTVIDLNVNDWDAITPSQFLTNTDAILSRLATAMGSTPYCVLLVSGYRPVRNPALSPVTWQEMRDGLQDRAVPGGNIHFLDLDESWPTLVAGGANNNGLMVESDYPTHPADPGHDLYADLIVQAITADATHPQPLTGAPPTTYVLATDVTNNNASANTIADVTGLAFPVTSGKKYRFRFDIHYTAAATGTGSRWSITGPGGTMRYRSEYSLTTTSRTVNDGLTAHDTPAASNATSADTGSNIAVVEGFYEASSTGRVTARFASEVSSSAIVAKAGSTVTWAEVL